MENSTLSQENGPREVCHALNFEFKVAPRCPSNVQLI